MYLPTLGLRLEDALKLYPELLVLGRPGGGKTKLVVRIVASFLREKGGRALFLTPLRTHREALVRWLGREGIDALEFKGKPDLCAEVDSLYGSGASPIEVLKYCLACRKACPFKSQFRSALSARAVVATHSMALLFTIPAFRWDWVIIDECDEYWRAFSRAVPVKEVELLEKGDEIDRQVAAKIKRAFVRKGDMYVPKILSPIGERNVYITATAPLSSRWLALALGRPEMEDFVYYGLGYRNEDRVIAYSGRFLYEFKGAWVKGIIELIEFVKARPLGVVSRAYWLTRRLEERLKGPKVAVDSARREADIYILTVKGRASRGVSLPDCKVVLATYQQAPPPSPPLSFWELAEDWYELGAVNDCANLQALFRFLRNPHYPHLVVLLDWRLLKAFERTTLKGYLKEVEKAGRLTVVDSWRELVRALKEAEGEIRNT